MKPLLVVFLFLLLGLLMNTAVAVICDARANGWNPSPPKGTQHSVSPGVWCLSQLDADGKVDGYEFSVTGYTARAFVSEKGVIDKYAGEIETGWPLRSFSGRNSYIFDNSDGRLLIHPTRSLFTHVQPSWWIRSSGGSWKCRIILRPVWFGLFVNTIAYAGCVWVLFTTVCRARDALVNWSLSKSILLP